LPARTTCAAALEPELVERQKSPALVDPVEVDIKQILAVGGGRDDMLVPHLVKERAWSKSVLGGAAVIPNIAGTAMPDPF
jgi:hypothetical protein